MNLIEFIRLNSRNQDIQNLIVGIEPKPSKSQDQEKLLYITVSNANKVTFDGRDWFITTLYDKNGMLFNPSSGRYDEDAVNVGHPKLIEAIEYGIALAKKRGIDPFSKLFIHP